MKTVDCKKLGRNLPGMSEPPYRGDLGQKIFDTISQEAWNQWIAYQTKLINELKLKLFEKEARKTLEHHLNYFLFSEPLPEGLTPLNETPTQKVS